MIWFTTWQAVVSTVLHARGGPARGVPAGAVPVPGTIGAAGRDAGGVRAADRGGRRRVRGVRGPRWSRCSPRTSSSTSRSSCAWSAGSGRSSTRPTRTSRPRWARPGCGGSPTCCCRSRDPRSSGRRRSSSCSRSRRSAWRCCSPARREPTIEVEIFRQTSQLLNLPVAAALTLVQLAIVSAPAVGHVADRVVGAGVRQTPGRVGARRPGDPAPGGAGLRRGGRVRCSRSPCSPRRSGCVWRSVRTADGVHARSLPRPRQRPRGERAADRTARRGGDVAAGRGGGRRDRDRRRGDRGVGRSRASRRGSWLARALGRAARRLGGHRRVRLRRGVRLGRARPPRQRLAAGRGPGRGRASRSSCAWWSPCSRATGTELARAGGGARSVAVADDA